MTSATLLTPGVWRAGTRWVNWYLLDAGGEGLTIVDAGLPAYTRQLDPVLAQLGRCRGDVQSVVLTHGHVDHTGIARELGAQGVPVHLHPADRQLAESPRFNRTERSPLAYLFWPATLGFIAHAVASGALTRVTMPPTVNLTDGTVADVPGRPVVTHVPGHTDGSCLLEFPDHDVVFVGDLLCTVSPITGRRSDPQLQTRGSNTNSTQALASLERLEAVQSPLVLPGHGGPWTDGLPAAIASARRIGCR
jgi:glyoxylase-like metal-dependent hydrolase (beta-lactamase superfamily II)